MKMQALIAANGFYPPGDSLWNHVSPQTRSLVESFCASNGLAPEIFARMKPWLALTTIGIRSAQASGMEAALGIDKYFLDRADGMRVEQLESVEWQLRLMASIPESQQERYLAASIQRQGVDGNLADLKAAWFNGDAGRLETLVAGDFRDAPEVSKKIFTDRNPHMADVVARYLNGREPAFVVVGAGHLVGSNGVVRQLQARGYKVEQVFSSR